MSTNSMTSRVWRNAKIAAITMGIALGLAGCCPAPEDGGGGGGGGGGGDSSFEGLPPGEGNTTISSFNTSKRRMPEVFKGRETSFYCGCQYKEKKINLESCGYEPRKSKKRASRLEWEHVVPASLLADKSKAWSEGDPACKDSKGEPYKGRRCASKVDETFKFMEADMYNLRPSIGEANGDRGNAQMGEIKGEPREYGKCDFEVDFKRNTVEPRAKIRGEIARTYLYMDHAYGDRFDLSKADREMFERWSKLDPVDAWEREWASRVEAIQGNPNPFVK